MAAPGGWLSSLLTPALKPVARLIVGLIAVPMLRRTRAWLIPDRAWDDEFEKDLEQWTRASLVLFLATKNVEQIFALWIAEKQPEIHLDSNWFFAAGRLLLAIGVIEAMPDQQLFSIIHPGPKPPRWIKGLGLRDNIRVQSWPLIRGALCMHLNRSSPVFAILAVIFSGNTGWVFYILAITQYLIIGLVTSRDKALDALSQFDQEIAKRREALVNEFNLSPAHAEAKNEDSQATPIPAATPALPSGLTERNQESQPNHQDNLK